MAKKEFTYRGFNEAQLKKMSLQEFSKIVPARLRRSLKNGFDEQKKAVIQKLEQGKDGVKTHARDMVILPIMIGKIIKVYNGKEFTDVRVEVDKVGHYLGEFVMTTKGVKHGAAGIGASKGTKSDSVK